MRKELQFLLKVSLAKKKRSSEEGFTLVELTITLLVIGILIAVFAVPPLLRSVNSARRIEAEGNIRNISEVQRDRYNNPNVGSFADTFQELQNLAADETSAYAETSSYSYEMALEGEGSTSPSVIIDANPNQNSYPVARGRVFVQNGIALYVVCSADPGATINIQNAANPGECDDADVVTP